MTVRPTVAWCVGPACYVGDRPNLCGQCGQATILALSACPLQKNLAPTTLRPLLPLRRGGWKEGRKRLPPSLAPAWGAPPSRVGDARMAGGLRGVEQAGFFSRYQGVDRNDGIHHAPTMPPRKSERTVQFPWQVHTSLRPPRVSLPFRNRTSVVSSSACRSAATIPALTACTTAGAPLPRSPGRAGQPSRWRLQHGPVSAPVRITDRTLAARENVYRAMDALGGPSSPAGSCVWHVVGCELSIREWALRHGWNGRRIGHSQAQGILVAALGLLAKHYGLDARRQA